MTEVPIEAQDLLDLLETNKQLVALGKQDKMLDYVLDQAIRLSGAERGFIIFQNAEDFKIASARNLDREDLKRADKKFSRTVLRQVMDSGESLLVTDAMEDSRLKQAESVVKIKMRSVLCVPILTAGHPLGALYLDNRFTEGAFQPHQVRLVSLFADQAALALNAIDSLEASQRHADELEKMRHQLAVLNEALEEKIETVEKERDDVREILGVTPFRKGFEGIVGNSKALREIMKMIRRLKETDVTIFIHGESGTGKELIARAIHQNSLRCGKAFLGINCSAFSEQLLDSELFGHVRGAFTGADRDRRGLFEEADGGTLFLDEVGDMSPGMQAKLLRVLQEKEIRPVGSNTVKSVDVRVVSASIKDLKQLVAAGKFREDLFYRLHVTRLQLPPLRERPEDIPELVQHFMRNNTMGIPPEMVSIDEGAMKFLISYAWPGNIRQLQNEIHRCLALGRGRVSADLLSNEVRTGAAEEAVLSEGQGLEQSLKGLEKKLLLSALEECRGNKKVAAEQLGISRAKLYQKMKQYRLGPRHGRPDSKKIRQALRETDGNRSLAAKRLGISRRALYDHIKRNS